MSIASGPSSSSAPPEDVAASGEADALRIGGFLPLSTIDFPGRLAGVVFLQGCPWRCPYCHNASLRAFDAPAVMKWSEVRAFLKKRAGRLDGVVFSGGEPTLQRGLRAALLDARALGYATALHTAGIFPGRLRTLLPLLDWVGLDVKAPPDARYDRITGRGNSAHKFLQSLRALLDSGVSRELRTTVDPQLLDAKDIDEMQWRLLGLGAGPSRIAKADLPAEN